MKTEEQNNYYDMNERFKRFPKVSNVRMSNRELHGAVYVITNVTLLSQKRELLVELMLQVDDESFIKLCQLIDEKELDEIMPTC